MKIDFHVHSRYSSDCFMRVNKIVQRARQLGLDGVAITDHNNVPVIRENCDDFIIIKGIEVLTRRGELIGLNVQDKIPRLKSVAETADMIREQGGLVVVPHPFDIFRKGLMANYKRIKGLFVMETINGMAYFDRLNKFAADYAAKHGIPQSGGSDAHRYNEIGLAHTELPWCSTAESAVELLQKGYGAPVGSRCSRLVHFKVFANMAVKPAFNRWLKR